MGWSSRTARHYKLNGDVDFKAECDSIVNYEQRDDKTGEVIRYAKVVKSSMVGRTYYAAVEIKAKDGNPRVVAFVFLTRDFTKIDGNNFGYKDMDETMGPCQHTCPVSILKALSPVEEGDGFAAKWREECWDYHAQKKADAEFVLPKCITTWGRRNSIVVSMRSYRLRSGYSGIRMINRTRREAVTAFVKVHCPLMRRAS